MSQNNLAMYTASNSHTPDLDWSQIRETIKMLNLSVAQVGCSLKYGDESIGSLTESFTSMAKAVEAIKQTAHSADDLSDHHLMEQIETTCQNLADKVQSAIVAFQFYDRLTQNLAHVSNGLSDLGDLVSDNSRLYNPAQWAELQESLRSRYTMQEEREMFDMILNGASVQEALATLNGRHETEHSGEVELF